MYRYDAIDKAAVLQRVAQFRDQTRRFLAGELPEEEFRPLRLRNGLYVQRHAPMLRIAVPYGLLSSQQLRKLAFVARKYDRNYGHFTTRQNLQLNWPKLEDVPDILEHLAEVEMHAIQTSGNCIRNVTADHLAGVARDEVSDPRPYCEIIRQWSTFHPEFSWLPRKFKIAVTGSPNDRAASEVHDIGLHLVKNEAGQIGFEVIVGGGLGRTPIIGKMIRKFLPEAELLRYLDAILRIYNLHGRRDNIHKARIKILVKALGAEEFARQVEAEYIAAGENVPLVTQAEIEHFRSFFRPHAYETLQDTDATVGKPPEFLAWYRYNTRAHRVPGYRVAWVSLKAHGEAPGDITSEQMELVADLADRVSFGEIRATHDQNLILAEVRQSDLYDVWRTLAVAGLATPNVGTLTDMICCPGLDFCSLANAGSIGIAKQIHARFDDFDYLYDLGPVEIKMSGCMNACGHHHVGHIGILGVDKHGEEWYQITLGGSASGVTSLGDVIGPSVAQSDVAETIAKILSIYVDERQEEERFLDTYRRIGLKPFRERIYAKHSTRS